jgi:hypothetical protein
VDGFTVEVGSIVCMEVLFALSLSVQPTVSTEGQGHSSRLFLFCQPTYCYLTIE